MVNIKEDVYEADKDAIYSFIESLGDALLALKERNMSDRHLTSLWESVEDIDSDYWYEDECGMEDSADLKTINCFIITYADRLTALGVLEKDYSQKRLSGGRDYFDVVNNFESVLYDMNKSLIALGEGKRCSKCGNRMVVKFGYKGLFLGCPSYPSCNCACDVEREQATTPVNGLKGQATTPANGLAVPASMVAATTNTKNNNNSEKKEEGSVMNMEKIFGGKVGKVQEDRFRLSLNGIAIKNNQGDYVVFDGEEVTNVSDFVVEADDIFYRIPAQEVEPGDLIIYHNEPVYVVEGGTAGKTIKVLNALSDKVEEIIPAKSIFGFQFFIKVVSLFNMGGGAPDMGGNMMLPLMLMGKDGGKGNDMLPLLLMSTMNGGSGLDQNMMLPLMLMGDKSGSGSMKDMMLPMMLMNGGLNQGEGGFNPLMFMMLGEGSGSSSMAELMIMSSLFQGKAATGEKASNSLFGGLTPNKKKGGRKSNAEKAAEAAAKAAEGK